MRMRFLPGQVALLVLFLLSVGGCSAPVTPEPKWDQAEAAVKLVFHADPKLNFYENQPHSVAVSIFQLDEPNAFQQIINTPSNRHLLLSLSATLPPSLASKRFYMMPGETQVLTFDRAERAKWIAVVAGYFDPEENKSALLQEISSAIRRDGLLAGEHATVSNFERIVYLGSRSLKVNLIP